MGSGAKSAWMSCGRRAPLGGRSWSIAADRGHGRRGARINRNRSPIAQRRRSLGRGVEAVTDRESEIRPRIASASGSATSWSAPGHGRPYAALPPRRAMVALKLPFHRHLRHPGGSDVHRALVRERSRAAPPRGHGVEHRRRRFGSGPPTLTLSASHSRTISLRNGWSSPDSIRSTGATGCRRTRPAS
jgi:hypothetical protein